MIIAVGSVVLVTEPPAPPFLQSWSRTIPGNPSGAGAVSGGAYLTYSSIIVPSPTLPGIFNASVTMEAINASTGQSEWSSAPLLLGNVTVQPEVLVGTAFAVLLVTSASRSGGNLTVLVANLSTGATLGTWSEALPEWSAILPPNVQAGLYNSTLVTLVPLRLNATLPLQVEGSNVVSGKVAWETSVNLSSDVGWGTGSSMVYVSGSAIIVALTPNGITWDGGKIVVLDGRNGAVQFERAITGFSDSIGGVPTVDTYYYLSNSTGPLEIEGIALSSGANTTPIRVTNVADAALLSAQMYAAGPTLIVASYSPSPSYAAYATNGSLLWIESFPYATSCGSSIAVPELGPCATALGAPFVYGNGSSALLSSGPFLLTEGNAYHNAYRLITLSRGDVTWSADYRYTFGASWPWSNPVPCFTVRAVVGEDLIYTVQAPGEVAVAGGVL